MKKVLALFMVTLMVYVPALAEDPEGTVIIANSSSITEVGTNPEFTTGSPIKAAKTVSAILDSAMEGVSAVAISGVDVKYNWCKWEPAEGRLADGAYEVFVFNIGQKDSGETWRNTATAALRDNFAKYDIVSKNGLSTRFVDQEKATGDANGYVSLGVFNFSGSGSEFVKLTKMNNRSWASYTYADKVKFVPVTSSEFKLTNVFVTADGTALETDRTGVSSGKLSVRVPYGASNYKVNIESDNPRAALWVDGVKTDVIEFAVTPGTVKSHSIAVTGGTGTVRYTLSVDMESDNTKSIALESQQTLQVPGRTASFVSPLMAGEAGYYNVYVDMSYKQEYKNAKSINVAVSHNGIREETDVDYGRYTMMNKSVYVGKYYFSGDSSLNEKIVVTKMTPQETGEYLLLNSVKLVGASADINDNPVRGFTIKAAGKIWGIPLTYFEENGTYFMAEAASTSIGFMATTANTAYDKIRINDTIAVPGNSYIYLNAAPGKNVYKISVTRGENVSVYTLIFYRENSDVTTIAAWQAEKSGTAGETAMLINSDGNAAQNLTSAGAYFKFAPSLTAGTYKVIAWRPAFTKAGGMNYGSAEQAVEIGTGTEAVQKTVDWSSLPSKYIDLGTYQFSAAGAYVKFTKTADFILMDKVKFVPAAMPAALESVSVDGEIIPSGELNGKVKLTENSNVNITVTGTGNIEINDEAVISGDPINLPLSRGVNDIKLRVYSPEEESDVTYNFILVSGKHIVWHNDSTAVKTGTWSSSAFNGSGSVKALYSLSSGSITFPLNTGGYTNVKGLTEVWVYRVEFEGASQNVPVRVYAGGKTYDSSYSNNTGEAAGWVKLGAYHFSGLADGSEKIVISSPGDAPVFADSVKLLNIDPVLVNDAAIEKDGSTVKASISLYNQSPAPRRIMVALSKLDRITGQLTQVSVQNINADINSTYKVPPVSLPQDEASEYKLMVWDITDGLDTLSKAVIIK